MRLLDITAVRALKIIERDELYVRYDSEYTLPNFTTSTERQYTLFK